MLWVHAWPCTFAPQRVSTAGQSVTVYFFAHVNSGLCDDETSSGSKVFEVLLVETEPSKFLTLCYTNSLMVYIYHMQQFGGFLT